MKKLLLTFSSLLVSCMLWAQVYTDPTFVTAETFETFYVYYDATQGNGALVDTEECYAHAGVVTNKSNGGWTHAPKWLDNSDKYKMTEVGDNLWKLEITGGLKEYYGLLEDEEVIKLAFVFRDATGTNQGKTAGGSDIFYELFEAGTAAAKITNPSDGSLLEVNQKINVKGETSIKGSLLGGCRLMDL